LGPGTRNGKTVFLYALLRLALEKEVFTEFAVVQSALLSCSPLSSGGSEDGQTTIGRTSLAILSEQVP